VFSNIYPGAAGPASQIAERIATVIFEPADAEAAKALDQARRIFTDLRKGKIDRAFLTPNANAYFSDQALNDHASSLKPLDAPTEFVQVTQYLRGGMTCRAFRIKCGAKTLALSTQTLPDGRIEQYLIEPDE
jgi:D-alanyl-D-alanine carboxypeptidase